MSTLFAILYQVLYVHQLLSVFDNAFNAYVFVKYGEIIIYVLIHSLLSSKEQNLNKL